jgi:hypothetical protein
MDDKELRKVLAAHKREITHLAADVLALTNGPCSVHEPRQRD